MFILDFNTYLYKATHLVTKEVKTFKFSHDYQSWVNGKGKLASEWKIIYLKGLATNDFSAVLEYFVDFEDYTRHIFWSGDIDGNNIETAFSDLTSNDKRTWILEHEQGLYDTTISDPTISFSDFMKKELVLYFMESNKRTMPSIMDGLKVSSRKIMFALMEKDKRTRWKIHDLASFVSREVVYHHRSQSLENTIFRMAVNSMLLKEASLYEDAKGIGYLDVEIHPIADLIFPKVDFRFLKYMCEDGKQVQPQFYSSIIPLVLVDGCKGIGTGYKTNIYKYNIEDIITNLRRLLDNEENNEVKLPLLDMMPILPGYKGNIIKDKEKDGIYFSLGKCRLEEDNNTILIIEQLPYKVGYEAYEKCLNDLKKFKVIRGFNKINESETSQYKVFLTKSIDEIDDSTMSRFYLKRPLPASSIYLYNAKGVLQYYSSPEKVVEEFFIERMKIYRKRKEHLELMTSETDLFRQDLDLLDAKLVELAREKKDEEATTNKAIEEARKKRDQYEDQYEDSHT